MKLTVKNLSFERNYHYLFEKINFELNTGELLQIAGHNGSGKTTLLRMIAGLIHAEEGNILWDNDSIFDSLKNYQENINYIGHQNGIKLHLNIEENIRWISSLNTMPAKANLRNYISSVIPTKTSIQTMGANLSAGQKRRLALARLTLNPAKLWILDEPTTALDTEGQREFFNLLKKHLSQGGMAIITSHHDLPGDLNARQLLLGENHA